MGFTDRVKKAFWTVAELATDDRENRVHSVGPIGPGDEPTAGALADAAAQTPEAAALSFPDSDASWSVERTWVSGGFAIASAVPSVDIGYERVAFAFRCEGDQAFPVGNYVHDGDSWVLLSSSGQLPPSLLDS